MRKNDRPVRAAVVLGCAFILTALPSLALAENYVSAGGASVKLKRKIDINASAFGAGSATFDYPDAKGTLANLGARFDVPDIPLFFTLGAAGLQVKSYFPPDPSDPSSVGGTVKEKSWGGNAGFGFVLSGNHSHEISIGLEYAHARNSLKFKADDGSSGSDCCSTSDSTTLRLGAYTWFPGNVVKFYGDLEGNKASHDTEGYGGNVGFEFALGSTARLFIEYGYESSKADVSSQVGIPSHVKSTADVIGAGLKFPWGGKPASRKHRKVAQEDEDSGEVVDVNVPPAPAKPAAAAVAAPAAETPAAPAPVVTPTPNTPPPAAGRKAMLKPGALLRGQPKVEGVELNTDATQPVTLKAMVSNADGKWWYVTTARGGGWVEESRFTVLP